MGIPEDAVAGIIIYNRDVSDIVKREEGGDVFFSLPHFFGLNDRMVRHGIVLKPLNQLTAKNQNVTGDVALDNGDTLEQEEGPRNVLLVSTVEREADIPPEEIFPLPEVFVTPDRTPFFTGIWFTNSAMIALIDPMSLITRILKDTEREAEA
ncbi:MAG: hypothetical protein LBD78_02365 [Spirochaetaceae bacterium]|jgi:hypothetical protein|nr:hypothetical protein [Spirochaetaceae bacterium]